MPDAAARTAAPTAVETKRCMVREAIPGSVSMQR